MTMKKQSWLCLTLALVLCLVAVAACGEGTTVASFFPAASYYHVACDLPGDPSAFDAVFYEDGSFHGVTDALAETCGYYAIMPDGTLLLDVGPCSFHLDRNDNGVYSGYLPENQASCTLTPIARSIFDAAVEKAGLYIDAELDRVDIPLWDYPVYARITMYGGIDLLVDPAWPDIPAGHLPAGTVVLICGQRYDDNDQTGYDTYLLEADGIRGFALSLGLEELPARRAKVVRSSSKDKGRTVNIRKTPDYGDNVIMEVPYGEIVEAHLSRTFFTLFIGRALYIGFDFLKSLCWKFVGSVNKYQT